MSNFPQYYFQDIPVEVMGEIMDGMLESRPEPTWEEIDHWVNCHNVAVSIPDWYERVAEFKVSRYHQGGQRCAPFFVLGSPGNLATCDASQRVAANSR